MTDISLKIFENLVPEINENVLVIFTDYKDTHIEAILINYESVNAIMLYEDSTRKKRVYDWKKVLPLNKQIVAKVEEIYDNNFIKISTAYFEHRKDQEELAKELLKPFSENNTLIKILSKICRTHNINLVEFWENVIYKIDKLRREDNLNDESLLSFITNNIDTFSELLKEIYSEKYDLLFDDLNKTMFNKITKLQTKIKVTSNSNVNNIKNFLDYVYKSNIGFNYTIKYESTPTFIIESSSENSSMDNHNELLTFMENNYKQFGVNLEY